MKTISITDSKEIENIIRQCPYCMVGITDADGALTFSGDYPHGEYYVQELAAPEGWVLSDARYRVTITDSDTYDLYGYAEEVFDESSQ